MGRLVMKDPLSKTERSVQMARVRSRGNQSTEIRVESVLRLHRILGWKKHPGNITGRPDFYFPRIKLAVFVDGCFWHACARCGRLPKTRRTFWLSKIEGNRRRDNRLRRQLREQGISTMRIWEHDLKRTSWLRRLNTRMERLSSANPPRFQ